MKYLWFALCILMTSFNLGYASGSTSNKMDPLATVMLRAIRNGMSTLSVLPAEWNGQDLIWAAWSDHGPFEIDPDDTKTKSNLALIRRRGSAVSVIWSKSFPGAFEPTIQMLYGSTLPKDRKIILLKYQLGGDEMVGTFFSLTAGGVVAVTPPVAAQTLELRQEQDNLLWSQASPADQPDCYRLDPTGQKLSKVSCSS